MSALCFDVPSRPQGAGLALCLALLAGCASTETGVGWLSPARVEAVTRLATYATAKGLLIRTPEARTALDKARIGFRELEAAERWDLQTAAAIATANGLAALSSPEGDLLVAGGIMLVDLVAGEKANLTGNENVRAFVVGARSGLEMALAAPGTGRADATMDRLLKQARATRGK